MSNNNFAEEPPRIRQTLFNVSKDRKYLFDVNQNITIKKLKKMIVAAANIGKINLRIFHKEVEYTDKDNERLDKLFPTLQRVEFDLQVSFEKEEDKDKLMTITLKNYCSMHFGKYPYFYCYTCQKSICSECLKSKVHDTHDKIEKYDYLQDSSRLVEQRLYLLDHILEEASGIDETSVERLRAKIKEIFFIKLVNSIRDIGENFLELIDFFLEKENANFCKIKGNVLTVKEFYSKGLNDFKNEISLTDMMLSEEIFLEFDKKVKELDIEKKNTQADVNKFQRFIQAFKKIETSVNQISTEINNKINSYDKIYEVLTKKINENYVQERDGKEITDKCHSEMKPKFHSTTTTTHTKVVQRSIELADDVEMRDSSKIQTHQYIQNGSTKFVCQVQQGTKQVIVFNSQTNKISRKTLEFPSIIGIESFLYNCAWVNSSNLLYISGGLENGNPSRRCLLYDANKNSFVRLQDMKMGHLDHSMYATNEYIYVVGGQSTQCEKYDIAKKEWTMLPNLKISQKHSTLYIHNNYLYSFFGLDSDDNYVDIIQRLNLRNDNARWENVSYVRNECNCKVYGCGIMKIKENEDEIRLLGGKDVNGVRNSVMKLNFKGFVFKPTLDSMEEKAYFKDSMLTNLDGVKFGNFSLEDGTFLVIQINSDQ